MLSFNHTNTRTFNKWKFGYQIESWLEDQFLLKEFPAEVNGLSIERKINKTSFTVLPTFTARFELVKNLSINSTVGIMSNSSGDSSIDYLCRELLKIKILN